MMKGIVALIMVTLVLIGVGCTALAGPQAEISPVFEGLGLVQTTGDPVSTVTVKWWGQCALTTKQLNDLGIDFNSITVGGIDTGETEEFEYPDGTVEIQSITAQGVAIEFGSMPPMSTIAQIDAMLLGCVREGEAYIGLITADDLPKSMHVAALKSVAIIDGSPRATVYRIFMGVKYEIPDCRVSQSAYDAYTSEKLKVYNPSYDWQAPENKDCFVLVYFISETPYSNEVQIPVIVDKVIK